MINLVAVDLGIRVVRIPVAVVEGKLPGQTLLITAGMDGDEYASIDAAYELIEEFSSPQNIKGTVIIIPIVNVPGFEAKRDYNPLDGKFPKLFYPGEQNGSPTQRLVHWLHSNYTSKSEIWLDLHGGALGEKLSPFVYLAQSGINSLDNQCKAIISMLPASKIILDKNAKWSHRKLHKLGKIHIVTEAGYSSERSRKNIDFHKNIARCVMEFFGIFSSKSFRKISRKIFSRIVSHNSESAGLWIPSERIFSAINKGQPLGLVKSIDGKLRQIITAQVSGEYLWVKTSMPCTKGETLLEIGTEK